MIGLQEVRLLFGSGIWKLASRLVLEAKSLEFAFWNFTLLRFHPHPPVLAGTEHKMSPGRVIA